MAQFDWRFALALAAAFALMGAFSGWRGSRPWNPAKGVRMMPWRWIMLLSFAAVMILLTYAAQDAKGP